MIRMYMLIVLHDNFPGTICACVLGQVCEHCSYRNANDYNWQNGTIILAADYASNGIYNFIIPLRAHFHTKTTLNPIIILLERRPDIAFLDAISYFPLVYWMLGSIDWYTHNLIIVKRGDLAPP